MFSFAAPKPRRRPSLTPMIDVVFLLLVFFMLAARFGQDFTLPLATMGSETAYEGPPRLVQIGNRGLRLNGQAITIDALPTALADLMRVPEDAVLLQPQDDVPLQSLIDVVDALNAVGLTNIVMVPPQ